MSEISAQEVRAYLLKRFADPLSAKGMSFEDVPHDFDLLSEGVIDSFGVLEMITALQDHFNLKIDFEELDPEFLTVIGPLCQFVEEKSKDERGTDRIDP